MDKFNEYQIQKVLFCISKNNSNEIIIMEERKEHKYFFSYLSIIFFLTIGLSAALLIYICKNIQKEKSMNNIIYKRIDIIKDNYPGYELLED